MNSLLIDTSNQPMSIALIQNGNVIDEINSNEKVNHSVQLLPNIQKLFNDNDINKKELNRIIVAKGPGSYTGVRIGVTVAKTLAYALKTELYGVSSLAALAATFKDDFGLLVPIIDARREAVYTGIYQWKENQLENVVKDQYLTIDELKNILKEIQHPYIFIGQDAEKLSDLLEGTVVANLPKASVMEELIEEPDDVYTMTPNYIKLSEAERNWLQQKNSLT